MKTETEDVKLGTGFKVTFILFSALALGQLLILVIFLFLGIDRNYNSQSSFDGILRFIIPIAGLISMFLSRFIYKQSLLKVNISDSVAIKLNQYRTFKIISWVVLEAASLLSLVAYFLTSNLFYIIIFTFIFGFFLINRPAREGFVIDMQLTEHQKDSLIRQ